MKNTVTSFITVLNGVITGKHHGDMNSELYETPYYGHEKVTVPFEAEVALMEPITFYTKGWKRKTDAQLIDEGLLPMPSGYVRENDTLRPMTAEERVIAGLDEPKEGFKLENGKIVEMSKEEKITAGIITNEQIEAENMVELNRRLAELQTPETLAQAEIDEQYAAERKVKLTALLAVKNQPGWPLGVTWLDT